MRRTERWWETRRMRFEEADTGLDAVLPESGSDDIRPLPGLLHEDHCGIVNTTDHSGKFKKKCQKIP